jgi:heme/copper-type cytochrome/quinol oxidase subunit 1
VFGTVDHKKISRRYLATAIAFLIIGGIRTLVIRLQLIKSQPDLVTPEA